MGCTWVLYLGILPKKDVFLRIKSSFVADVFLRRKTTLFEERCLPSSTDIIYERRRLSSKKDVFSVFARTSGRPARWVTAKGTGPQGHRAGVNADLTPSVLWDMPVGNPGRVQQQSGLVSLTEHPVQ